nr:reverse transcriptase domain-containing protein [Tanacetum cinerariifolium]
MLLVTPSLTGFSGETIWPLGYLRLLVTIGDTEHYTKAWMNFMIVRSPSSYNGIIGRPEIREIQAVPSTTHGMLKFLHHLKAPAKKTEAPHENFNVAIHLDFPDQEITIGGATSVKGQILADFLVEKPDDAPPEESVIETPKEPWTLFTDGLLCVDGSEYKALIVVLRITAQMGVRNVHVSIDSKLMANQVLGTYVAKEENMIKYLEKTKNLISGFANFSISQVPRIKNKKADALSKIASTSFAHLSKQVLVEILKEKFIQEREMKTVVEEEGPTWMTPIIEYLRDETLPDNQNEASKLRIKAIQYELLEGILYKRSFLKPWLRTEAVIPAEIGMPTYRTAVVDAVHNDEELRLNLDLLEERGVTFRPGDFVYRSTDASYVVDGGKLGLK